VGKAYHSCLGDALVEDEGGLDSGGIGRRIENRGQYYHIREEIRGQYYHIREEMEGKNRSWLG